MTIKAKASSSTKTAKSAPKTSTKSSPKSKPKTASSRKTSPKLTGLQRLKRRKLKRFHQDGHTLFSDRDLNLLLNELGFPGGIKIEEKIGVTNYTAEEGWEPGFYIWKIGQDWKFTLENHSDGGIHFTDISGKAPQELVNQLIEEQFITWLADFLGLDQPLSLLVTPDAKLAVAFLPQDFTSSSLRRFTDQLTKDRCLHLNHHDLKEIIVQTCLPTNSHVKPDQLEITSISSPQDAALELSWADHQVTLTRPKWGGVQAAHHRGNRVIEDQFTGAYFFNWLSQVLQASGDLFAEITPDGCLRIEKR